jgi:acid phosphatase
MNPIRLLCLTATLLGPVWAQPSAPASENLNAVLWVQRSAEYKAIALQTFQSARLALMEGLKDRSWTAAPEQKQGYQALPPAIILDLDETVLDNGEFNLKQVREGATYSEPVWQAWVNQQRARAIPGAAEFLNFARARGVAIFYVTNRACEGAIDKDPTAGNLRRLHFPVEPGRLLCRGAGQPSDKSPRRAQVAAGHRVIALFGDDLNDFVFVPPVEGDWRVRNQARDQAIAAYRDYWGVRWFVLPNPLYGSWERAIGLSVKEKVEALRP